jgi:hypothetical protein
MTESNTQVYQPHLMWLARQDPAGHIGAIGFFVHRNGAVLSLRGEIL